MVAGENVEFQIIRRELTGKGGQETYGAGEVTKIFGATGLLAEKLPANRDNHPGRLDLPNCIGEVRHEAAPLVFVLAPVLLAPSKDAGNIG